MFDTGYILKDAGQVTSSGYGTVDAAAQVAELSDGLVRGNMIVDVSQMALGDSDELYQIHLMGGDDESFTNEVALATLELGAKEQIEDNKDSKLGRYVVPFQNEKYGVVYPYVRVRHAIGGTSPAINYEARLEKNLEVTGFISTQTSTTTT